MLERARPPCRGGTRRRVALIWDSPVTGSIERLTYREMRDRTALVAGMLAGLGVRQGDRVLIYMPMMPEAAIAMLACARIGAVHSVVFGGFAAHELATRIDDARPRVVAGGLVRHRGEPDHPVQALARRGDRRGAHEAGSLRRVAAADVPGRTRAGPRS